MHKTASRRVIKLFAVGIFFITYLALLVILFFEMGSLKNTYKSVKKDIDQVNNTFTDFQSNFNESLFNDHLAVMSKQALDIELNDLKTELTKNQTDLTVSAIYQLYSQFETKLKRNENYKLKTEGTSEKIKSWGELFLNKDFENLTQSITQANTELDDQYDKYLASLPKQVGGGEGYSSYYADTSKGRFLVKQIKMPLSQVRVKTIAAQEDDCDDNCPTKSLEQYVKENNAYAGMNGSYFCPPDYSSCNGKVNTFDYAFYDSNDGKWFNERALTWFNTGMFTFRGNSYSYYKETSDYDGDGVDAAISNYPSLVEDGEVDVSNDDLTSFQKDIRGARGVLGAGSENIYLVIIYNATVPEAGYVAQAIGLKNALNIDGGGSTAMYINGGYVVGPGRSLPNAILLLK